jgi:hypothetical protein
LEGAVRELATDSFLRCFPYLAGAASLGSAMMGMDPALLDVPVVGPSVCSPPVPQDVQPRRLATDSFLRCFQYLAGADSLGLAMMGMDPALLDVPVVGPYVCSPLSLKTSNPGEHRWDRLATDSFLQCFQHPGRRRIPWLGHDGYGSCAA